MSSGARHLSERFLARRGGLGMTTLLPRRLKPDFGERFIEQAGGFIHVGLGDIEHGGEANDVAVEAALADQQAVVAGALHQLQIGKGRSEEHTSELQSLAYLVCRLLLEKKKKIKTTTIK